MGLDLFELPDELLSSIIKVPFQNLEGLDQFRNFMWVLEGRTQLQDLFERFRADSIRVTVRKETPVLDGIVDSVGVEMERTREEMTGRC